MPLLFPATGGQQWLAGGGGEQGATTGFRFVRFLVENDDQITFQARRLAAIKAFDTVAERDREAGLFRRLRWLRAVPAVVDAQMELVWNESDERRVHALALEWARRTP